jgi:hypothetical protein
MSEPNDADAVRLAGHAVLYGDGTLAFHADDCDHVISEYGLCEHIRNLQLPPMLLPLLTKVLSGGQIESSDVPAGGPFGLLAKTMARRGNGG